MKSFTRGLLVLLLIAVPVLGMAVSASANTEMVPASRLVGPLIDVSSGRDTFLLLVNVSRNVPLTNTPFTFLSGSPPITISNVATGAGVAVHLEFYNASCIRIDRNVLLTFGDIDQLDIALLPGLITHFGQPIGRGWVDLDVRINPGQAGDPSVQANVLMGTAVVSDFQNDFAFAYPLASSIGSSQTGLLGTIVTKTDQSGRAANWTGRYEAFPPRVFVPAYFAEGTGTGAAAGQVFTTLLVMAGPADGNWSGTDSGDGNANTNTGEAPGQQIPLGADGGTLLSGGILLFDGCEQQFSANITSHYFHNSLGSIWGPPLLDRANWSVANCGPGTNPGLDEFSGQPVGWVDFENTSLSNTSGTRPTATSTGGIGVNRKRGVVGVFLENVVGGTPTLHLGDATRLWGEPSFTQRESQSPATNCTNSAGGPTETGACQYSLVDWVCHLDSASSPSGFPTGLVLPGIGLVCP